MLGADKGIAIFQKYAPYAPALVLGNPVYIMNYIFSMSDSEFNVIIGVAESAGIVGTTYG